MFLLQANMLTGGILGSGIQASLQDVVLQSHLMANMQTTQGAADAQPTGQCIKFTSDEFGVFGSKKYVRVENQILYKFGYKVFSLEVAKVARLKM